MNDIAAHYLDEARRQMRGYKRLAEGALAQVKDDEFFRRLRLAQAGRCHANCNHPW